MKPSAPANAQPIDKFLSKGWREIRLNAGKTSTDVIPIDPAVDDIVIFGQQFDVNGTRLSKKLFISVEETEAGAVIEVATKTDRDVRFLFRVVCGGEEMDEEETV